MSLKSLVTLNTLSILANYGPTQRNLRLDVVSKFIAISIKEAITTKQSNLFQFCLKYIQGPYAICFIIISKKNTLVKT